MAVSSSSKTFTKALFFVSQPHYTILWSVDSYYPHFSFDEKEDSERLSNFPHSDEWGSDVNEAVPEVPRCYMSHYTLKLTQAF